MNEAGGVSCSPCNQPTWIACWSGVWDQAAIAERLIRTFLFGRGIQGRTGHSGSGLAIVHLVSRSNDFFPFSCRYSLSRATGPPFTARVQRGLTSPIDSYQARRLVWSPLRASREHLPSVRPLRAQRPYRLLRCPLGLTTSKRIVYYMM
jgi:hypothetical protein